MSRTVVNMPVLDLRAIYYISNINTAVSFESMICDFPML